MSEVNESAFPQTTLIKASETTWSGDIPGELVRDVALAHSDGLTKRELFAAMAMQAIIADLPPPGYHVPNMPSAQELAASKAVSFADALIARLAKERP